MIKFSVKKPLTVIMVLLMVVVLGYVSFTNMSTDLLPNMELPYVAVITVYGGATPEKVEIALTKPLEQVLATTGGVENMTSVSAENYSMILLEFAQSVNMDSAIIEMTGNMDTVMGSMEDTVSAPIIMKINPDMIPVSIFSVDIEGKDITETSTYVSETIIPRFERIDGVASVSATGLIERSLKITLDQTKIDALNDKVIAAIDATLLEAKAELEKAETELANGETQLNNTKTEKNAELAAATVAIDEGFSMLQSGKATMADAVTQLNLVVTVLDGASALLNQASANIPQYPEYEARIRELITSANSMLATLATASDRVVAALPITQGVVYDYILRTNTDINRLLGFVRRIQEIMDSGVTPQSILADLNAEITKTNNESKGTLAYLDEQSKMLDEQYKTLQAAQEQLETGKLIYSQEIAAASAQLSQARAQLEAGKAQLEASEAEAYKQAGLSGAVSAETVSALISASNFQMPAGSVTEDGNTYAVKVGDLFADEAELLSWEMLVLPVGDIGAITIEDVATVETVDNSADTYSKINGNDGIFLTFQKQSTASTTDVSHKIQKVAAEIEKENSSIHVSSLNDQGIYIDVVVDSVITNLLLGGGLAIIILFIFLRRIKPTFIIAISIPSSLLFAVVLMYFSGVSLNIVSLGGLALGVGMLVDNSIVAIENIYRMRSLGESAHDAAIKGSKEIAGAIIASTLTTVSVFVPILFASGITKQIFSDMGLTIAYSLLASLIVALTLVPTLGSRMLTSKKNPTVTEPKKSRVLESYGKVLRFFLKHKALPLALSLILFVASLLVAVFVMGSEFIPVSDSAQMNVTVEVPVGSSESDARAMSKIVEERILTIPAVKTCAAMQTSSGSSTSLVSLTSGSGRTVSIYMVLHEKRDMSSQDVAKEIERLTADLDCVVNTDTATTSISMLTGSGVSIAIRGEDLDVLEQISTDFRDIISEVEGTENASNGMEDAQEEIRIIVDKNAAAQYNLTVAQVYMKVAAALKEQTEATTINIDNTDHAVVVSDGNSMTREGLAAIEFTVTDKDGEKTVLLSELASVTYASSPVSIQHVNQVRTYTVTAGVDTNHNVGKVGDEIEKRLAKYDMPAGYIYEIEGENEYINTALKDLVSMVLLAVLFIYMIMVAQFQSLKSPFIVMFTIPLAFTGGIFALFIFGFNISVIAMLGLLVLAGVVVNNGIVFVDYANQLVAEGKSVHDALVITGQTRMRPILMTALTTILGMSTIALAIGTGTDMLQPMGVVTIGGLTYATLLTLFVVPMFYDIFNKKRNKKKKALNTEGLAAENEVHYSEV